MYINTFRIISESASNSPDIIKPPPPPLHQLVKVHNRIIGYFWIIDMIKCSNT